MESQPQKSEFRNNPADLAKCMRKHHNFNVYNDLAHLIRKHHNLNIYADIAQLMHSYHNSNVYAYTQIPQFKRLCLHSLTYA